jgi:hypothetical protein
MVRGDIVAESLFNRKEGRKEGQLAAAIHITSKYGIYRVIMIDTSTTDRETSIYMMWFYK